MPGCLQGLRCLRSSTILWETVLKRTDIVLPSSAASVCSDTSILPCPCIQLTLSCQVPTNQCGLTPSSPPFLVYSWHCRAKYCRISVFWLLPPSLFFYTVLSLQCVQAPPSSSVLVYSWHCLANKCRISLYWFFHPPMFLYTADVVMPSTAESVWSDSSPVLVYSWHCFAKYRRISMFWLLPPPLFVYTADIDFPSTAASVCSDSSLLPCSCIQLTLSC